MTQRLKNYYQAHRTFILWVIGTAFPFFRYYMVPRYGREQTTEILGHALADFEALLPRIPEIGGRKNLLTNRLWYSAFYLAFYRAMKRAGKSIEESGEMIYRAVEHQLRTFPYNIYAFINRSERLNPSRWAEQAARSQRREFPGDWVFTVVEGDGVSFDLKIEYAECAILKFFQAMGAQEFMPYICFLDEPISHASGTGMQRTTTLALGGPCCDCALRYGHRVIMDWYPSFYSPQEHTSF